MLFDPHPFSSSAVILDSKLDFNQHKDGKINRCNKFIKIIKRLINPFKKKLINNIKILC